jgi:hypothetical protein
MAMPEMLVVTSADFSLVRGTQPVAAGYWDDVISVRAFKRDEFTTDVVYLALTMRDGSEFLANEDAPGWEEFLEAAERTLPKFPRAAEWLPKLIQPAYARNETTLFNR